MPDRRQPSRPSAAPVPRVPAASHPRLLRTFPLLAVLVGTPCLAEEWLVQLGPLALEASDRGIEAVSWRDIFVFGDHHSNRRPVAYPRLLAEGWRRLAEPDSENARLSVTADADGAACMDWEGVMREVGGPGTWAWRQNARLTADGVLRIDYECRQTAAPAQAVAHHRYVFVQNRQEVLAPKRGEKITRQTAGKPVSVTLADGEGQTVGYGESPNAFESVRAIELPFHERRVRLRCEPPAARVEFWNGGWAQMTNVRLGMPDPAARVRLVVDMSELLDGRKQRPEFERIPQRPRPWLTADIPPRTRPKRPLRFAQCTPSVMNWHGRSKLDPAETERLAKEMAKHFDVVELIVAWADWGYSRGWDREPEALATADALAAKVQEWIDIGHKHGLMLAVSLNFGGGEPGAGKHETRRRPEHQAEIMDPGTGELTKLTDQFDWANPAAVRFARDAWLAVARKIKGADFLFFNEPLFRLRPWHRAPFFSEAALADYRRFRGDPDVRLPAKPWVADTARTDNSATLADWVVWEDWAAAVYVRRLRACTEAFREANRDNSRYQGAIWFQNVSWVGPEWATDLDLICALPGISHIVCEYCTDAESEHWRRFKYFAHKHGKGLSSFVNMCWYDGLNASRYRFQGDDDSFRRAVQMGVRENADMISLYHSAPTHPWHPAYHPARTRIWDEVTKPYCLGE